MTQVMKGSPCRKWIPRSPIPDSRPVVQNDNTRLRVFVRDCSCQSHIDKELPLSMIGERLAQLTNSL